MATLVLTAAVSATGITGVGGALLGLGAAVAGNLIDRALFGRGDVSSSSVVAREGPRLREMHITASTEGAPVSRLWGRSRLGGEMIWATRFREVKKTTSTTTTTTTSGGKGGGGSTQTSSTTTNTTTYHYFCSFAVAFCEGPAASLGRVWADGKELDLSRFTWRFHRGTETQTPDSFIETVEGAGNVPAYRGVSYLVFEEMPLESFGNRIPQITAEIMKPTSGGLDAEQLLKAVTLIPGSGEFVYATTIHVKTGNETDARAENMNNGRGVADIEVSLDRLGEICPNLGAVLLVVAWFGDDLRAGSCTVRPRVEVASKTVTPASWRVNGVVRSAALTVSVDGEGRPVYGGTPSDHVVVEAIKELKARGHEVIFYPFVLMDIPAGNGLPDPYGGPEQGAFPWRGRITCDPAPGEPGTVDKTAAAASQVDSFFGAAAAGDFTVTGEEVDWSGGAGEWGYRRMALHYAHLCEAAGGVDGFVIASELVGLTGVRSSASAYPAVGELATLAGDLAGVLAASTKLTYAADWSEYHSHRPDDGSGDVHFNLDPLWADANIDAVGIDNYLPLADWRDGIAHLDYDPAGPTSTYDLAYLQANIEGGEFFDWFYVDTAARDAQTRTTITDAAYSKPWVFRDKDIRGWWLNQHFDRPAGVESGTPTAWTGEGKPVWFTEFGCPAVDKGANQPNVFVDPKSSESALPYYSSGRRDDLIQRRYLEAHLRYWDPAGGNNPISSVYSDRMIDTARMFAWTWDARPYPDFPFRADVWSDAPNYELGHWLTGRLGQLSLARLVELICGLVGLTAIDVTGLYGINTTVKGFVADRVMTPRAMLETLMRAFQFDAFESGAILVFRLRGQPAALSLAEDDLALGGDAASPYEVTRAQESELPQTVRVTFIDEGRSYLTGAAEGRKLVGGSLGVVEVQLPVVLAQDYARGLADAMVQAAWINREAASAALPPSRLALDAGDVVDITLGGRTRAMQIGRISAGLSRVLELTEVGGRVPGEVAEATGRDPTIGPVTIYGPTTVEFLDIPLLPGAEVAPHAPRLAAHQLPWPGEVAIYRAQPGGGFQLINSIANQAVIGELTEPLASGPVWRWDRASAIEVQLYTSQLSSSDERAVLAGGNVLAIENADGGWEIVQYVTATLLATRKYRLTQLLRGQLGTETEMRDPVAAGARVVLLDADALEVLDLTHDQRLIDITYRHGPAPYGHDHQSFTEVTRAFAGVGLRPLSPSRLDAVRPDGSSDISLSWIRRTRIGGDSWDQVDVPLAEESEAYEVDILDSGVVVRTIATTTPQATYTAAEQTADWGAPLAAPATLDLEVYQLSATFGRGIALSRTLAFPLPVEL